MHIIIFQVYVCFFQRTASDLMKLRLKVVDILIPDYEFVIRFNGSQLVSPLLAQQTKISKTEKYLLGLALKVGIHL